MSKNVIIFEFLYFELKFAWYLFCTKRIYLKKNVNQNTINGLFSLELNSPFESDISLFYRSIEIFIMNNNSCTLIAWKIFL